VQFVAIKTSGVSHCGLAIYIKKTILRKKKNYNGNSKIAPCKNIIFQKSSYKKNRPIIIIIT
jgi:hypothetical protein